MCFVIIVIVFYRIFCIIVFLRLYTVFSYTELFLFVDNFAILFMGAY